MKATILALLMSLLASQARASRSSFSPTGSGSKVLYLLFEDLGYSTTRAFNLREVDAATRLLVTIGLPAEGRQGKHWLDRAQGGKALVVAPPLEEEGGGTCRSFKLGALQIERDHSLTSFQSQSVAHPELELRRSACVLKAPPSATVLAGRPDQALALELTVEGVPVLVLAHEDLLVNQNLDRDDLVVLLRRWVAAHVPFQGKVTFLEEKQGGQLLDLIRRSNLTAFALHGLLWLLLLYWALAPRFGDPFPPPSSTRRAFAEHARALGALYRHRGASAAMLRHQFDRFLARLTGRSERRPLQTAGRREPRGPGRPGLAAAVATRTGRDVDSVESLLAQLDRAMQEGGSDPRQIQRHFRLSQSLAALSRVSAARGCHMGASSRPLPPGGVNPPGPPRGGSRVGGSRVREGRSGIR